MQMPVCTFIVSDHPYQFEYRVCVVFAGKLRFLQRDAELYKQASQSQILLNKPASQSQILGSA